MDIPHNLQNQRPQRLASGTQLAQAHLDERDQHIDRLERFIGNIRTHGALAIILGVILLLALIGAGVCGYQWKETNGLVTGLNGQISSLTIANASQSAEVARLTADNHRLTTEAAASATRATADLTAKIAELTRALEAANIAKANAERALADANVAQLTAKITELTKAVTDAAAKATAAEKALAEAKAKAEADAKAAAEALAKAQAAFEAKLLAQPAPPAPVVTATAITPAIVPNTTPPVLQPLPPIVASVDPALLPRLSDVQVKEIANRIFVRAKGIKMETKSAVAIFLGLEPWQPDMARHALGGAEAAKQFAANAKSEAQRLGFGDPNRSALEDKARLALEDASALTIIAGVIQTPPVRKVTAAQPTRR